MTPRTSPPSLPVGPLGPTSYKQKQGNVVDSQPRVISNLIVDQTSTNPAAIAAAQFPVRTQGNKGVVPCTTDPDTTVDPPVAGVPADCVPSHKTLFIPNVTTDVGLSPPYNSLFTFFGQFFDHGVDQTVKSGANVFVPLKADDPLRTVGPDGKPGTGDEVPANQAFMVLTRAQNQPGPDGILGNADDIQNANNTDSPWVDQSQTYTSHASHQVFLRDYDMVGWRTGRERQAAGRNRQRRHVPCGHEHRPLLQRRQRHGRQHLDLGRRQAAGRPEAGSAAEGQGRDRHPDAGHGPVRRVHPGS